MRYEVYYEWINDCGDEVCETDDNKGVGYTKETAVKIAYKIENTYDRILFAVARPI